MTISRYTSDWNKAMIVLVAYGLVGLLLVIVPVPVNGIFLPIQKLPMIEAMQHRSFDLARMIFFWQWMIIVFPFMFLAFSLVAPIKVTASKIGAWYAIPVSVAGFVFFGLGTFAFIWALFFNRLNTNTKSGRIIMSMANGPWDLCFVGDILMFMLLCTAWWSFIAIPASSYKVIKLRTQQSKRI